MFSIPSSNMAPSGGMKPIFVECDDSKSTRSPSITLPSFLRVIETESLPLASTSSTTSSNIHSTYGSILSGVDCVLRIISLSPWSRLILISPWVKAGSNGSFEDKFTETDVFSPCSKNSLDSENSICAHDGKFDASKLKSSK